MRHQMAIMRRPTLVLAALVAGCASARRGDDAPSAAIEFTNEGLTGAEVFSVSRSGTRVRLGAVMAGRTEVMRLPLHADGGDRAIDIVARLAVTSREVSTGLLTLGPGERVIVTLLSDGRMLSVLPARDP